MGYFPGKGDRTDHHNREGVIPFLEGISHLKVGLDKSLLIFIHLQDEAFSIWSEWASFYPPRSEERELLEGVRDKRWLVSLLHHDYQDMDALWNFLDSVVVSRGD